LPQSAQSLPEMIQSSLGKNRENPLNANSY